ncbi:MAG: DUF4159 domain-containing protein, partial [Planctomycetales bacterium]|nr:DUF4159 domain-containing protein [Planctomycetales bacterium]
HDFRFTPAEREALRGYIEDGGTLFADAICGSDAFAKAFRREMSAMFPDRELKRTPVDHRIFTPVAGGFDIRKVQLREPAVAAEGQPLRSPVREVEPLLESIEIDGRLAVIFSPYDVSCALEQHEAIQCRGYDVKDAARIGLNVLMYALTPDAQ